MNPIDKIEEYDAGYWMMFMASSSFVSLIISTYSESMLLAAFHEDIFGDKGVTYTMVEK